MWDWLNKVPDLTASDCFDVIAWRISYVCRPVFLAICICFSLTHTHHPIYKYKHICLHFLVDDAILWWHFFCQKKIYNYWCLQLRFFCKRCWAWTTKKRFLIPQKQNFLPFHQIEKVNQFYPCQIAKYDSSMLPYDNPNKQKSFLFCSDTYWCLTLSAKSVINYLIKFQCCLWRFFFLAVKTSLNHWQVLAGIF